MDKEMLPADVVSDRLASLVEMKVDQLMCKHLSILLDQLREVLRDDVSSVFSLPNSRPLAPERGPAPPRNDSFFAKVKTKAGLDKPHSVSTLSEVERAMLCQLTSNVTLGGKRTSTSPLMLAPETVDPPVLQPTATPSGRSRAYGHEPSIEDLQSAIMPVDESRGSKSSTPATAKPSRDVSRRVTDRGSSLQCMDRDSNAWILESGVLASQRTSGQDPGLQLTSSLPMGLVILLRVLLVVVIAAFVAMKVLFISTPGHERTETSFPTITCCVVYGLIALYCLSQLRWAMLGANLQHDLAKLYHFVDDFQLPWHLRSRQEARYYAVTWASSLALFMVAQGLDAWLQESRHVADADLDGFARVALHAVRGLFVLIFGATSALAFIFAFVQSHLLMGLDKSLDCWCCDVVNDPNFEAGTESWNTLQALLKSIGRELALSFAVAQGVGYFGLVLFLVMLFHVLLRSDLEALPTVAEGLAALPLLVLLALNLRVCFHAAALTQKCGVIPAFVNQIPSGLAMDTARQYLVRYVADSSAGFFVGSVRLTQEVYSKQMYLLATLLSGLTGVVARVYL